MRLLTPGPQRWAGCGVDGLRLDDLQGQFLPSHLLQKGTQIKEGQRWWTQVEHGFRVGLGTRACRKSLRSSMDGVNARWGVLRQSSAKEGQSMKIQGWDVGSQRTARSHRQQCMITRG